MLACQYLAQDSASGLDKFLGDEKQLHNPKIHVAPVVPALREWKGSHSERLGWTIKRKMVRWRLGRYQVRILSFLSSSYKVVQTKEIITHTWTLLMLSITHLDGR